MKVGLATALQLSTMYKLFTLVVCLDKCILWRHLAPLLVIILPLPLACAEKGVEQLSEKEEKRTRRRYFPHLPCWTHGDERA